MLKFLFPTDEFTYHTYNEKERTFSSNSQDDPWTFEWLLKQLDIDYQYGLSFNDTCYVNFNLTLPTTYEDLKNIPQIIWDKIKNDHNIFLLLYQPTEATPFYYYMPRWKNLRIFLENKKISYDKIKYISGDIDAEVNHKKNVDYYWSNIDVIGLDIFELIHNFRHKTFPLNARNLVNKKKFLCLMNVCQRPHRQILYFYLKKYNLANKGLLSYRWTDDYIVNNLETFDLYNFDDSNYEAFRVVAQIRKDIHNPPLHLQDSPLWYYENTEFSLVSETFVVDTVRFITEKTYKPLIMGHPFLIYGTPKILQYLKNRGYETFPNIFDESYDDCSCLKTKTKLILDNLKNYNNVFTPETKEKLKHNQNHFSKLLTKEICRNKIINFLC